MIVYGYLDETEPSGMHVETSKKKIRAHRAASFERADYPELFMIDIGKLTHQRACDLLNQKDFAEEWKDME